MASEAAFDAPGGNGATAGTGPAEAGSVDPGSCGPPFGPAVCGIPSSGGRICGLRSTISFAGLRFFGKIRRGQHGAGECRTNRGASLELEVVLVFHQSADDQRCAIGKHDVGGELGGVLVGDVLVTVPELLSGWISIRIIRSVEMKGRIRSKSAGVEELDLLDRAVKFCEKVWNPRRVPSWISAHCLFRTRIRGLASILVLPIVSSACTNPVTLLATNPNLAPFAADASPVGSAAAPAMLPAVVSGSMGIKPTCSSSDRPLPISPKAVPRLSTTAKLTPSCRADRGRR